MAGPSLSQARKVKGEGKVICALAFRYFKRISSHAKNIMSSVVMPLDKLNYASEDDEKN